MTTPPHADLLAFATPYALHAIPEPERVDVERQVAMAPADVAAAFADEVRAVRETMARVSAATALDPPQRLRDRVLADVTRIADGAGVAKAADEPSARELGPPHRRHAVLRAAAIAVVVGVGAVAVLLALRHGSTPSTAEQVIAATDVQTVSSDIAGGGRAMVMFSREKDAGVLVMNGMAPPRPGTAYQMWLVGTDGPHSAGTVERSSVGPSTTVVLPDLQDSHTLAFTVEPAGGSAQPTSPIFATLSLP